MKVAVLHKYAAGQVTRSRDDIDGRPSGQRLGFYVVGLVVGLLLSQYFIHARNRQLGQDYVNINLVQEVPRTPTGIYITGRMARAEGVLSTNEYPSLNRLEQSLLLSAILIDIQYKVRQEIEKESLILVDPDMAELRVQEREMVLERQDPQ